MSLEDRPLPEYYKIKMALLNEIRQGRFVPGQSFITEKEVCRRFGVSRITAARALNDLVREGVLTRRRGLGTFVTGTMESPPQGHREGRLIACIFEVLHGHHLIEILRGIEEVCRAEGFHTLLFDSMLSAQTEVQNLRRARQAGAAGVILYPVDGSPNAVHIEALLQEGMPVVMVDRYYPNVPTDRVLPDSWSAGYLLTKELIGRGHKHIATVWGETSCTSVQENLAGHLQALREHGLEIIPDLTALRPYDSLPEDGRLAILRGWMSAPYRPTAMLAANSHVLTVVAKDLARIGLEPGQVALASAADDNPEALYTLGAMTAVLPSRHMGVEAARLLMERIKQGGERPYRHVVLPVTIVPHISTDQIQDLAGTSQQVVRSQLPG